MPLFICDECGVIENTALGFCSGRKFRPWKKGSGKNGKALCSDCVPDTYANGNPNPRGSEWHGTFERVIATEDILKTSYSLKRLDFEYLGKFEYLREN